MTSVFYVLILRQAKVVSGIRELVNAMLHICLGGSIEGRIIGEQEVVDDVRLNLGLRLQRLRLKTEPSKRHLTPIPVFVPSKASVSVAENIKLKSVGARTQPCFTLLETENGSEDSPRLGLSPASHRAAVERR